jgi:uncharacterized membrane protein YfcA
MFLYLASFLGVLIGILFGTFLDWLMGPWSVPFLILLTLYLVDLRRRQNNPKRD